MTTTTDHGITIEQIQMPAGRPFRASCLCGWQSKIVGARPHAIAAARRHADVVENGPAYLAAATTEQITTELDRRGSRTRASHCSCGRPARRVLDGGKWGSTGYCGIAQPPLDRCDCGQGSADHDRSVCHIYGRGMA